MIISHRGNLNGRIPNRENTIEYIDEAIYKHDLDVEIDVRCKHDLLYLGHDTAQEMVTSEWLRERSDRLWIHTKTPYAFFRIRELDFEFGGALNYFYHGEEPVVLTSKGYAWVHPLWASHFRNVRNAVIVTNAEYDTDGYKGVCTDYAITYKSIRERATEDWLNGR